MGYPGEVERMAKTLVDIDEEALRLAMAEYGTTTKVDTVNRALRAAAAQREEEADAFLRWAVSLSERLAACDVRRYAWTGGR